MNPRGAIQPAGVGQVVDEVLHALSEQASLQFELLKAEQARDTTALVVSLMPIVLRALLFSLGYLLSVLAIALALGSWIGAAGGFAVVGGVHLIGGGLALKTSLKGIQTNGPFASPVAPELEAIVHSGVSPFKQNSSGNGGDDAV